MNVIDLFAGPGGWDLAAKTLGLDPFGIEWDGAACETREAAGLRTKHADVAALDPADFAPCDLLIASPPCQAFSRAGKREGIEDLPHVYEAALALAEGHDVGEIEWRDERAGLVTEPLRWALALEPDFLAWEQVPDVLPFWRYCSGLLEPAGWHTWTGIVEAERYGVPQTRERAILLASRLGPVEPPRPTHQRYVKGEPQRHEVTLEGEVLPWVSMAEALGWEEGWSTGHATAYGDGMVERHGDRPLREASEPSHMLTSKARSWTRAYDRRQQNSDGSPVPPWPDSDPAPTLTANGLAKSTHQWVAERPSRGKAEDYDSDGNYKGERSMDNAVRVSLEEAAILQSFPPDYPFQGSRTKQFEQVGNAVPPLLAHAVLSALVGSHIQTQLEEARP